ncbi:uncharacterized protein LOC135367588 [Ornithodoros turicata]|uniref:uncharacterized protein LOC135367588 n=1 Tax=Ornithodoros turicata TaxID=34597 RepID=UPI0031398808
MGTISEDPISLWLKLGALDKLEQALMDGYGEQLIGKTSRIPQVARFLKQVPTIQAQIEEIHEAIMQGNLEQIKDLLSQQRKLTFCRDQQGASPLHKAVLFQQRDVVTFFVEHFPSIMHARDHQGRTPLHYAAVLQDDGEVYRMLRAAGSDDNATDVYGHTPDSYLDSPGELTVEQLKEGATVTRTRRKGHRRRKSGEDAASTRGYSAKPAGLKVQIREIIAQGNLEALEELVLHGHGDKLLGESSPNPLVQEFLDTVPGYMEQINDVHRAVIRGRLREVQTLMNHKSLALARDSLGATPIHKAVMYGHEDIAEHLAENFPECLSAKDVDGRTALHYAALLKDGRKMYSMLIAAGAPPAIVDYKGKSAEYFLQYPEKLSLSQIIKRNQLANATYMGNTITRLKTMAPGFPKTLVHLHEKYNFFNDQVESGDTNGLTNGADEVQSSSSGEHADKNLLSANPVEPMKKVMLRSRPLLPAVILPRLEVTSANIRKWIEEQDLKKLEGAVLEGYGERLTQEVSCADENVEQYLKQDVPRMLERIRTIHRAVTDDDVPQLETQLDSSDYALARDHLGMTPLHKAVILGRHDVVKLLVDKFPETINARDREGRTALHYAAASARKNGRRQIYKLLLQNGSDSRIRDNRGKSSEFYKTHHLQIPPEVAQLDPHVRARSKNRLEAPRARSRQNSLTSSQLVEKVTSALQKGNLSQVQELAVEGYGKHLLGRTSWSEEVRHFLKALPHFLQTVASVHEAAATGNLKQLKELTDANEVLLKARNEQGNQPIHTAVESKDMDTMNYILEKLPASINAKAAHGRYPIHLAALLRDNDIYKFLVEKGANPRVLDQKGRTAEYYMRTGKGDAKSAGPSDSGITWLAEPKPKTEEPECASEAPVQPESQEPQSEAANPDTEKEAVQEATESESKADQDVKTVEEGVAEVKAEKQEKAAAAETKPEETENSSGAGESDSVDAEGKVDEQSSEHQQDSNSAEDDVDDHGEDNHEGVAGADGDNTADNNDIASNDQEGVRPDGQISDAEQQDIGDNANTNGDSTDDIEKQGVIGEIVVNETADAADKDQNLLGQSAEGADNGAEGDGTAEDKDGTNEDEGCPENNNVLEDSNNDNHEDLQGKVKSDNAADGVAVEDGGAQGNAKADVGEGDAAPTGEHRGNGTEDNVDHKSTEGGTEDDNKNDDVSQGVPEDNEEGTTDRVPTEITEEEGEVAEVRHQDKGEPMAEEQEVVNKMNDEADTGNHQNSSTEGHADDTKSEEQERNIEEPIENSSDGNNNMDRDKVKRIDSKGSKASRNKSSHIDRLNELIDLWIKEGDLLRLEHVVIAGQGERLRNKTSDDKQVQEFLSLVPTYMDKIKGVHDTVVRGNLDEVKQVLTRKRFALSRDQLGASPLHLAVLHGHTDVLEFIIQRFPETLDGPDNEGRTPLHYAAVVAEGQKYFDILKTAGADDTIKDKLGHTPEYYLNHTKELTIRDLLDNYKVINGEDTKSASVNVWKRPPTPEEETAGSAESQETQDEAESPLASEPESKQEKKPVAKVEPVTETMTSKTVKPTKAQHTSEKVAAPITSPTEDVKQLVQNMLEKDRPPEDKQFLMSSVGDTLIEGLLAVVKKRPDDPAEYLASWLTERASEVRKPTMDAAEPHKTMPEVTKKQEEDTGSTKTESNSSSATSDGSVTHTGITEADAERAIEEEAALYMGDHTKMKDEQGQTVLHFAASHSHRDGCFYALVRQGETLLAERDIRYQTARDVARDAGQQDNVLTIDQYVLDAFLEQREDFIQRLVHQGYDQAFKVADRHGRDVTTLLQQYELKDMQTLMQDIADFQKARDELHSFVRKGYLEGVLSLVRQDSALVTAKNHRGRCALHIAVLAENCDIMSALIKANPDAVHLPDNMGRTPLHYAMGLPQVTAMGQILIRNGATRTARDVKMRTPSYFFIYKQEIKKLKIEETPD